MAVAAALHHSANKKSLLEKGVVEAMHNARQGQKTGLWHRAWALVVLLLWRCRRWRLLPVPVIAAILAQAELDKRKKKEEEMEQLKAKHKVKKVTSGNWKWRRRWRSHRRR